MNIRPAIRKAAVLGAGVMGAQIAAHLANADIPVVLFDLPAQDGADLNAPIKLALKNLGKLEPAPLALPERAQFITPANYEQHLALLRECDLIIEAIAERPDWKADLYRKVAPYITETAYFVTNTSGLSITQLAQALPPALQARFCGMHFFNPPRYMHLVELIPHPGTDAHAIDVLETFLTRTLGKGVIRAKDTPNFIANRIGVFSMLATLQHTQAFGLSFDLVDALTGPAIGRPKSATYRTADVVGLDTFKHVVEGSARVLPDDPWLPLLSLPDWFNALLERGALGQKTRQGIYKKQGKDILVLDPASGAYQAAGTQPDEAIQTLLKMPDPARKFAALRASDHPQAQFLWAIHRDVFHYAAYLLADIADTARDVDLAMRWGFGWQIGPFELWQAAGWQQLASWIKDDIANGKTLSATPLPDWVDTIDAVHTAEGSYSAAQDVYKPRHYLPVYLRQDYPEQVLGEARPDASETVFETAAVRLWRQPDTPHIAILSFRSKLHTIGDDVLDGVLEAITLAERDFDALVLWQNSEPFSVGANLAQVMPVLQAGDFATFEQIVAKFQRTTARLRYSRIPVVAACRGLALGGGCEFLMHCDHVVAALESYIGLVEVGVGLLPAGGGCKEFARRAALEAKGGDPFPFIKQYFETVAMGTVAKSAEQARQLGFLKPSDTIIFNPHELLHVAKAHALALAESTYRPPLPQPITVAGRTGVANLKTALANMQAGGFISAHDFHIGSAIAEALCGGMVDAGSQVDEDWLLTLERKPFVALAQTPATQARIAHMLQTGKPLRN